MLFLCCRNILLATIIVDQKCCKKCDIIYQIIKDVFVATDTIKNHLLKEIKMKLQRTKSRYTDIHPHIIATSSCCKRVQCFKKHNAENNDTLRKRYSRFQAKHPKVEIRFSMLASLQPKWPTNAGASDIHLVSVCTYHQNVQFMLSYVDLDKTYHDFTDTIAYDQNSNICMIHCCKSCHVIRKVEKHLKEYIKLTNEPESVSSGEDKNRISDFEEEKEEEKATITFKQRVLTE